MVNELILEIHYYKGMRPNLTGFFTRLMLGPI